MIWLICGILLYGCGASQQVGRVEKSPDIPLAKCLALFQEGDWNETLNCLDLIKESARDQSYFDLKGSTLLRQDKPRRASEAFEKALERDTTRQNPYLYVKWGESLWQNHEFLEAGKAMGTYLDLVANPKPEIKNRLAYFIRSATVADSLYRVPRQFYPNPFSAAINTDNHELGISMTYDRRNLIITRRADQEDLYESQWRQGQWQPARPMDIINTPDNEGAAAISGDGHLLVFTACNRPQGVGSCDLYFSRLSDTGWTSPSLMPDINTRHWDSQPTLSPDGRVIVFSSERPGGYGGRDLWLSVWRENRWIQPINLGPKINSPGNEENPFLHADEYTLYFTSDYWPGFGGRDLFMAHRLHGNQWSKPVNLGYPINSLQNEEGVFIESSGQTGYFSSERNGQFDLYSFEVDRAIQPRPALLYKMIVVDSATLNPLQGFSVQVYDKTQNELVRSSVTDFEGHTAFLISGNRTYGITVSGKDYGIYSYKKILEQKINQDITDTIQMAPVQDERTIILENVHFRSGESQLLESSDVELNELADYLLKNRKLTIMLWGHTDSVGQASDNQILSQERAEAVKSFLVRKGVAPGRIEARGMGESQPLTTNETVEGRQRNRRTEIRIITNE